MRSVFCSYLSLLVNAKDDLALARTLDVPSRALGRQTFTDVRHAAGRTGMSLFLVSWQNFKVVAEYRARKKNQEQ